MLSDSEFSTLISFYGSLSIPSAEAHRWSTSTFRLHPVASASPHEVHWSFVLTLAKDMKACARKTSAQDRFWIMRAALAEAIALSRREYTAGVALLLTFTYR